MTKYRKLFIYLFIIFGLLDNVYCNADDTHSMLRGEIVILECPIDVTNCGELHSVKWFKGNERIAVLSGDGKLAKVESDPSRISIDHLPAGPITRLRIKNLDIDDEDTYLCESTFVDPLEACTSDLAGYKIDVKILVPPSSINMLNEEGMIIQNTTTLGPLREGHTLTATCEVLGTRPTPIVRWYRAGNPLPDLVTSTEKDGLFNVKNDLKLKLSRQELGSFIECRVETPALKTEVSNQIQLDLQVRPTAIKLDGVEHHVVQGTNVLLQCTVSGARPAANVTWYNKTQVLDPAIKTPYTITTDIEPMADSTYVTVSKLIFTASRFENEVDFKCEADNIVMRDDLDKPLHDTLTLEVMYPPVVWVSPTNTTVNETANVLLLCEYLANPASLTSVRWLKNGEEMELYADRFEGGIPESTALLIKNVTRHDIGNYTCKLANSFGDDESDNAVVVDIQYVPIVNLTMSPEFPVIENDLKNVTLFCNVVEGNPTELIKVRWFLDGTLLKELPECGDDSKGNTAISDHVYCDIESNQLLLQSVSRDFWGNYSCEGLNAGGWGERSNETELVVYYEPGNATLVHFPPIPIKRKSVTFQCSVDDGGNPNATRYRWLRNGKAVMDVVTPMWIVDSVGLDSRTNFSCYAYNEGGNGIAASEELTIHAPPFFIQKLTPYSGALFSTPGISLSCRVECYPECQIEWFKEGVGINDETDDHYFIKSDYLPSDPATGDFESVLSILNFNMSAWPGQKLDIFRDNANYSCVSTRNDVGPGVRSTVFFAVEYPPENITATESVVVQEGSMPPKILCSAKGFPEPSLEWNRNDEVIASGNALIINKPMQKKDAGPYVCTASNRHGAITAEVFMNITYKPDCSIVRKEIDSKDMLICTATGNPAVFGFTWSIKNVNDSSEIKLNERWEVREEGDKGYLILDDDTEEMKTYRCVANNSVGIGSVCEIDVAGHLPWYHKLDSLTFWIIVIGVPILLIAVIIICIIIICICRKRRRQEKYHTDIIINSAHSEHDIIATHPDATTSSIVAETPIIIPLPSNDIPKSPPKWTMRPGVLVHMKTGTNRNTNAAVANTQTADSDQQITDELINFTNSNLIERLLKRLRWRRQKGLATADEMESGSGIAMNGDEDETNGKRHRRSKCKLRSNGNWFGSGKSTNSSTELFSNEKPGKHIKGVQCTDSVVTYKKSSAAVRPVIGEVAPNNNVTTPPSAPTNSRKRKKSNPDKSSVAGDPLTEPGEYENLPFHGLQSAPNKLNFHNSHNNNNSIHLNTNHSNIVRVAPRPKNISSTYQTSLSSTNSQYNSNCINNNNNNSNSFISKFNSNSNSNLSNKKHKSTSKILTNNFYPIQQPPPTTASTLMHSQSNHNNSTLQQQQQQQYSKSNSNFSNFLINYPINYSMDECPVKNIQQQSPIANHRGDAAANPFLVKNHKYYDQYGVAPPPSYHHNNMIMPHTGATNGGGGMPQSQQLLHGGATTTVDGNNCDKLKFNSLKNLGIKKAPQFYSMRLNKKLCRRHNNKSSNNSNSNNINNNINNNSNNSDSNNDKQMPYSEATINNENQPVYVNLTDSIQIHEQSCASLTTPQYNGIINDRTSIYRSDSGISNSSYECLTTTPIAAPRGTATNGAATGTGRKCHSAPVYMNVPPNLLGTNGSGHSKNNGAASGSSSSNSNHNNHHQPVRTKHGGKMRGTSNLNNSMGGFLNFERSKNNPFIQQSRRPHQQHILVPKELFPSNTAGNAPLSSSSHHANYLNEIQQPAPLSSSSSTSSTSSHTAQQHPQHTKTTRNRPIKLPLRKHHSFHFQTSQTTMAAVAALKQTKKNYKNTNGPLIFKPFENSERSAFKPITPAPRSPEKFTSRPNSANKIAFYTPPRICGTSLKRHMSNVETTMGTSRPLRTNNVPEPKHYRSTNSLTESDNDDESILSIRSAVNSTDVYSMPSKSKVQYADLLPLETSGSGGGGGGGPSNNSILNGSGSANNNEKIKLKNFTSDSNTVNNSNNINNNNNGSNNNINNKRTITQYATLKFNEVNI